MPPPSPPPPPPSPTFSCFLCLSVLHRKLLSWQPTAPPDLGCPCHLSYSALRRATSSFSAHNRLGQGGFGSVFRGVLPRRGEIAVKLMDSTGSLQGEREFSNELLFAEKTRGSDRIVKLIGFSFDSSKKKKKKKKKEKSRDRLVLVYELMHNGSLQEALINRKCEELMDWEKRFAITVDVAKGLEFLHFGCHPPIIHGDVKPSNVLLDCCFNAKISDFGLARVKSEEVVGIESKERRIVGDSDCDRDQKNNKEVETNGFSEDHRFVNEETASVTSTITNSSLEEQSPASFMKVLDSEVSPELGNKDMSHRNFDQITQQTGEGLDAEHGRLNSKGKSEPESVKKDYVQKWVLSSDQVATPEDDSEQIRTTKMPKKDKNHPARKWWREEFYEELTMKNNNKKQGLEFSNGSRGSDDWWQSYDHEDSELEQQNKLKKKKNKKKKDSHRGGSWGSIDWWLDGFSGELRTKWASTETPKSSASSTHSMRGTVCYTAPENCGGGGEQISEKCDVYSYGVLLLVLVSGRRPLQVTVSSPNSGLERANLISWARCLACKGKVLDLVDSNIRSLNRVQAVLCIKVALLCLQRSAKKRPNIREVLDMLSGKCDPPHLPSECSTSPPIRFPSKSLKRSS